MSNRAEGVQAATGVHSPKHGWQTSTRLALFGLPRGTPYLALLVHQQHKLDHGSPRACSGSGAVVGNQALLLLRHCCCLSRLTYDSTVLLLYQSWQNRTSAAQTSQKLQSVPSGEIRSWAAIGGLQGSIAGAATRRVHFEVLTYTPEIFSIRTRIRPAIRNRQQQWPPATTSPASSCPQVITGACNARAHILNAPRHLGESYRRQVQLAVPTMSAARPGTATERTPPR